MNHCIHATHSSISPAIRPPANQFKSYNRLLTLFMAQSRCIISKLEIVPDLRLTSLYPLLVINWIFQISKTTTLDCHTRHKWRLGDSTTRCIIFQGLHKFERSFSMVFVCLTRTTTIVYPCRTNGYTLDLPPPSWLVTTRTWNIFSATGNPRSKRTPLFSDELRIAHRGVHP